MAELNSPTRNDAAPVILVVKHVEETCSLHPMTDGVRMSVGGKDFSLNLW